MHDLLFDNQRHLKLPQLRGYAQRLGARTCCATTRDEGELYLQRVREQVRGGERSGVRGTPTFFSRSVQTFRSACRRCSRKSGRVAQLTAKSA